MPSLRTWIRPWIIVTVLCLIYTVFTVIQNGGDPLALVTIGTRFSEGNPTGTEGYDGQFVYYIARDPSTATQYIDVPAYRFQRILLPMLARFLAFGQVSLGDLKLILSGPGASGSRPMPDGGHQEPGGWNRVVLEVRDLPARIRELKGRAVRLRNEMEVGPGGKQIQVEDPDGNPIELFEPASP